MGSQSKTVTVLLAVIVSSLLTVLFVPAAHSVAATPGSAAPRTAPTLRAAACKTSHKVIARQLRAQGATVVSRRAKARDVARCRGAWAYMQPTRCQGDCQYVARLRHNKWKFYAGFPAPSGLPLPAWIRNHKF